MKCMWTGRMLAVLLCLTSCGKEEVKAAEPAIDTTRQLKITIGDRTLTATLYDNPTARDFASCLPLTIDLTDYDSSEKVFTPSPRLTTQGSPSGMNPRAGDIALFAPWGNIAIFYRKGTSSGSLIPVGRIENGLDALELSGTLKDVKFELIEQNQKKP